MAASDSLFNLEDKVALVTGATSGLGEHFARVLRGRGANLVLTGRRRDKLNGLAEELGHEHTLAVPMDMTDEASVRGLIAATIGRFGRLDVMVNNAGTADGGPAEDQALESFQAVLAVNLSAVFACCREAARAMLPQGGSIINIASIAGLVSLSDRYPMAAYASSKAGVIGLTRELAAQWASRGVRVNAIAPGWFPTELTGHLQDRDQTEWIVRRTPVGRPGRLQELDGPLVFLASAASSYVVGQTIVVDGGWTLW